MRPAPPAQFWSVRAPRTSLEQQNHHQSISRSIKPKKRRHIPRTACTTTNPACLPSRKAILHLLTRTPPSYRRRFCSGKNHPNVATQTKPQFPPRLSNFSNTPKPTTPSPTTTAHPMIFKSLPVTFAIA